jgi:hypothetical protein
MGLLADFAKMHTPGFLYTKTILQLSAGSQTQSAFEEEEANLNSTS